MKQQTVTEWLWKSVRNAPFTPAGEPRPAFDPLTADEIHERAAEKLHPPGLEARRLARLQMGTVRYESRGYNRAYDNVGSAIERLEAYRRGATPNREHLVDAINLLGIEWGWPSVEGGVWAPVDDGIHTREIGEPPCAEDALYGADWYGGLPDKEPLPPALAKILKEAEG